jgi:hypothetical protein
MNYADKQRRAQRRRDAGKRRSDRPPAERRQEKQLRRWKPALDPSVRPLHALQGLPPPEPPPPRCGEDSAQANAQAEGMRAANPEPQRLPPDRRLSPLSSILALAALGVLPRR